jgi:hypothetical protein
MSSSSVPTGFSRFLVSLALLVTGAGVALMAVQNVPSGSGLVVAGLLLWGISRLFRSQVAIRPIQQASSAVPQASSVEGRLRGTLDEVPPFSLELEIEEEPQPPTAEELWEHALEELNSQARLGWPSPEATLAGLGEWKAKGVDLNMVDEEDLALFDYACLEGAPLVFLDGLVALGVDPRQHAYMLDKVLQESDPPADHVVAYLLEHGANPNGNPRYARGVPNAELESGSSLLEICLDRELSDAIVAALLKFGAEDVWCDDEEESLLSLAIYRELPLTTIALLGQAFDVNAFHGIALRKAISEARSVELVELLCGMGANPFLRDDNDENAPAQLLIEDEQWEALKVVAERLDLKGQHRLLGMVDALANSKAVAAFEGEIAKLGQKPDSLVATGQ